MKKHLSLLLFAIVASTTMLFASEGKEVTIDGLRYNLDEQNLTAEVIGMSSSFVQDKIIDKWDQFPAEYVFEALCPTDAALLGLKSVKVYADKTYINILVEPVMEYISDLSYVPFHVFLNTDNSDQTGGYGDEFVDANSDIMLEGGFYYENEIISYTPYVFKWWGEVGGYGWEWVDPNVEHSSDDCWGAIVCEGQLEDCTSQYIDGKIEIKINRNNIPATWNDSEFGIGFDIQQNWESVGILPLVSPTEEDLRGLTHKLQVKIDDRESEPEQPISDLVIPETVSYDEKDYSVTSIGRGAFWNCNSLTSINIPNSVTSIGEGAFYNCNSLTSPVYNAHLFAYMPSSYSGAYTIPEGIESIVGGAFAKCSQLASVTIPNSVISIGRQAFIFCTALTSANIPNSVTYIGDGAFAYCSLINIVLGSSVETISSNAFLECVYTETEQGFSPKTDEHGDPECPIKSITCYSTLPPSVVYDNEQEILNSIPYLPLSTPVFVPADNLDAYKAHDFWGRYDVRAIGAESVQTDEVEVDPATNSVEIVWPAVEGAETYELVIKDKQGNVICTLIFNANGQLISIVFSAPARDNAAEQTQSAGFAFTVTGLQSGTTYDLTITAKDSNDQILQSTSQTFTTAGLTCVEDVVTNTPPTKLILGGQILILRGDKTYTVHGQEVR